ncbi:hypothetical protein E8E12_001556 [Didymella heteroderae]|uniref:Uncharacterized protein n=1 Tax=Didymella heteroderae TaxID=1769908 RepID=A0A9P5BXN1_9PLEO|nr:hypothetical protein E8E12_001556 [Didymella heteroderae]
MSKPEQNKSSGALVADDDDRSQIRAYPKTSKYRVGDTVKVINSNGTRTGPYNIATIVSTRRLASLLKSMTDKGLIVTYLKYDPQVDAAHPSGTKIDPSSKVGARFPTYRNASMRHNWLVDPDGYTTIAACGPTEMAKERTFNDQRHGVLSYFLADIFKGFGGVGGKLQYIHQLLRARFQSVPNLAHKQTPMFYGNKQLDFFGYSNHRIGPAPIPVIIREDGSFQIEAGRAHDIRECDRFAISAFAFGVSNNTGAGTYEDFCTAEVLSVGDLTSTVKLSVTNVSDDLIMAATELTRLSLKEIPIRLENSVPHPELWKKVLDKEPSLQVYHAQDHDGKRGHSFTVAFTKLERYEIRDQNNRLLWDHSVGSSEPEDDVALILGVLEHLAKFEMVKRLENHST